MKYSASLLLVLFLTGFTTPKNNVQPKIFIPWNADKPVQWADFKGQPLSNSREAALTASSIEFSYETNGVNTIRWQVHSKFFPEMSWSKKDHRNSWILKHEQLHFDITEIYARIMRKRFLEEVHSVKDLPKFKTIAKQVMSDWNKEQNDYDSETKHSINKSKQEEWNQAVAERLDELSAYTATHFKIQK